MKYLNNLINFSGKIKTKLIDANGGWFGFEAEGLRQEKMPIVLVKIPKKEADNLKPGMTFVGSGSIDYINEQWIILCSDIKVSKEGNNDLQL